jgi:hypothetical protein
MHIILKQIYYKIKRNSNKISSETNISKKIAQNKIHQEAAAGVPQDLFYSVPSASHSAPIA